MSLSEEQVSEMSMEMIISDQTNKSNRLFPRWCMMIYTHTDTHSIHVLPLSMSFKFRRPLSPHNDSDGKGKQILKLNWGDMNDISHRIKGFQSRIYLRDHPSKPSWVISSIWLKLMKICTVHILTQNQKKKYINTEITKCIHQY